MTLQRRPSRTARALALGASTAALYATVLVPLLVLGPTDGRVDAELTGVRALAAFALGATLIALSTIDALTFELPDVLTYPLATVGILVSALHGWSNVAEHLVAAVVGFAALAGIAHAYRALRRRAGLGLGDAKLLAAAGAWLGLGALPTVLLLASLAALATVALAAARSRVCTLSARLPFGPYLALAFWLVWLYGPMELATS